MPLTKLFKKRHSLKDVVQLANEDIEKLNLTPGTLCDTKRKNEQSENGSRVENQSVDDEHSENCDITHKSAIEDENFSERYEYFEKEISDSSDVKKHNLETRRQSAPPGTLEKLGVHKTKSVPHDRQNSESEVNTNRRKKCVSESMSQDLEFNDISDVKNFIQIDDNSLEKIIGRCVNQIIKESILTAVKNVNVDGICEEILENISNRRNHSSRSNSEESHNNEENFSEITDKNLEDGKNSSSMKDQEEFEYCVGEQESEITEVVIESIKTDNRSLDGYIADFEESISLHSTDIDTKEQGHVSEAEETISAPNTVASKSSIVGATTDEENDINQEKEIQLSEDELTTLTARKTNCEDLDVSLLEDQQNVQELTISFKEEDNCEEPDVSLSEKEILQNGQELTTSTKGKDSNGEAPISLSEKENNQHVDKTITPTEKNNFEESGVSFLYTSESTKIHSKDESTAGKDLPSNNSTALTEESIPTEVEDDSKSDNKTESSESSSDVIQNCETVVKDYKSQLLDEESDLMILSPEIDSNALPKACLNHRDSRDSVLDSDELPQDQAAKEEEKIINKWKVGYLHVKLPHKARSKSNLKAWKKRCVSIQPDEFVNDPKNPCLMISVYSAETSSARKHGASFWKSISGQKAVVYRSGSRTHKYAFSISDDNNVVIHLATDSETKSQEWMAAIRSILWPPSPVMELEKMLNGKEFEVSIIDNDFALRAGLLGTYGYLSVTSKKLILIHSQAGYVIQEWYLNTVDKFEVMPQNKVEDANKVLAMTTCSDSSTGKGALLLYCAEAVALLQAIALTIHQILTEHIKQEGGEYEKELAEIADWLVPTALQDADGTATSEDYYKVPPRQVKSLLDIPNFIFDKPITPSNTVSCSTGETMEQSCIAVTKSNPTRASQDSGISAGNVSDDFLNSSITSFVVGGGTYLGKSSDSELSDSYTPPRTPEVKQKREKSPLIQTT